MGHTRRQAKGSKKNRFIQSERRTSCPTVGLSRSGNEGLASLAVWLRGPGRAGSWQLGGRRQGSRGSKGRHMDV